MSGHLNPSKSTEDYLKAIFKIAGAEGKASTTQLASHLNIAPASVTGMLKKLSSHHPPLVVYRKHRGASLTPEGKAIALETLRHHRLIELFLVEILGYSWDEVHEEAERLEHVISEKFEERIAKVLNYPEVDPHGDPIPGSDLSLPDSDLVPLIDLRPPSKATIKRVRDSDSDLLVFLETHKLIPGSIVEIVDFSDKNICLIIQKTGKTIILEPRITNQVFVEKIKD